jgi:hypothetical protein
VLDWLLGMRRTAMASQIVKTATLGGEETRE